MLCSRENISIEAVGKYMHLLINDFEQSSICFRQSEVIETNCISMKLLKIQTILLLHALNVDIKTLQIFFFV